MIETELTMPMKFYETNFLILPPNLTVVVKMVGSMDSYFYGMINFQISHMDEIQN